MKHRQWVKNFPNKIPTYLPGFSLIELALVLIIIGILVGAIFKGQDIVTAAKMRSVLNQIDRIRTATTLYHDTYGHWPGNDPLAKARFGDDVTNGQGNGIISGGEAQQFWVHLAKAEHLSESAPPSSKLGGYFTVEGDANSRKNFLILSHPNKAGLLTPQQAASLKAKAGENSPSVGQIYVIEGIGSPPGTCIQEGAYNLTSKTPTCILMVELY